MVEGRVSDPRGPSALRIQAKGMMRSVAANRWRIDRAGLLAGFNTCLPDATGEVRVRRADGEAMRTLD